MPCTYCQCLALIVSACLPVSAPTVSVSAYNNPEVHHNPCRRLTNRGPPVCSRRRLTSFVNAQHPLSARHRPCQRVLHYLIPVSAFHVREAPYTFRQRPRGNGGAYISARRRRPRRRPHRTVSALTPCRAEYISARPPHSPSHFLSPALWLGTRRELLASEAPPWQRLLGSA